MNSYFKNFLLLILFSVVLFSCRKEEIEIITPPSDEVIGINSTISNLLLRTAN